MGACDLTLRQKETEHIPKCQTIHLRELLKMSIEREDLKVEHNLFRGLGATVLEHLLDFNWKQGIERSDCPMNVRNPRAK